MSGYYSVSTHVQNLQDVHLQSSHDICLSLQTFNCAQGLEASAGTIVHRELIATEHVVS